jgi:hypothetical protein
MRVLARWECPEHGVSTTFGSNPSRGGRYSLCPEHGTIVEAVWVEYVHPDDYRGAVERAEKAEAERDEWKRVAYASREAFGEHLVTSHCVPLSSCGGQ